MKILLEACLDTLDAAIAAEKAGIDRIELCSALVLGGLTPGPGLLRMVLTSVGIPVYVLIRSRAGDFCYTDPEKAVLLADITAAKEAGAAGVVIGALNPDGDPDLPFLAEMAAAAQPIGLTFHRAFDRCRDPERTLEALIGLGFERVLTSGQQRTATEGAELIARLVQQAAGRISIMPGAGISPANARALAQKTHATEIHFSAVRLSNGRMQWHNPALSGPTESQAPEALPRKIAEIRAALATSPKIP